MQWQPHKYFALTGGPAIAARVLPLACVLAGVATAQSYPVKSIRLIVGSWAGGGGDTFARVMSQALTGVFNQQVIIDNRAGAGGRTRAVNRVPACGM